MVVLPHHVVPAVVHHRQLDPVGAGTATKAVIGPEQGILTTVRRGWFGSGTALIIEGCQIENKALDTMIIDDLYALHRNPLCHGGNQKICIRVEYINYAMGDRRIVELLIFWKSTDDHSDFLFLCYGLININIKVDVFNVTRAVYIWPPSPSSPKRKKKNNSKKSKRQRSPSTSPTRL